MTTQYVEKPGLNVSIYPLDELRHDDDSAYYTDDDRVFSPSAEELRHLESSFFVVGM